MVALDKKTVFLAVVMGVGLPVAVLGWWQDKQAALRQSEAAAASAAAAKAARLQAAAERARVQQAAVASAPAQRNFGELAGDLCALLRQAGATTCDVHWNVLSASYVDATFAVNPAQAQQICLQVAGLTRVPGAPFGGWSLKLFSPLGVDRPMAVCAL